MAKPKILVADDVKQNVKLLRVILSASDYDVVEAYDGEETLEKVRIENPDLILLDVMMPKITGYEVCKKLRANEQTKNIPIVMITALHEMDDRINGIEAGANDFISKPFNKAELLARVKSLLSMRPETAKKPETTMLDTILSNLEEGVIVVDEHWAISSINKTAQALLNIPEKEAQKNNLLTYLSQAVLSVNIDKIANTQENTMEFQIKTQNAAINAKMVKSFSENGNVIGTTFILKKAT